jgi:hypothetical protein
MQQHDMTKWVFRAVIVLGAIGFATLYSVRHDWSKGWMPSMTPDYQQPVSEPASDASTNDSSPSISRAPVAAPTGGEPPRCQPFGRTARGELVYSMDCEQIPRR